MCSGKERPGRITNSKKSLSIVYKSHHATCSTAANKALITVPNEPLSLYQFARHSLTWRIRQREGIALPNNLSWRWVKLPPRSHDNPALQLFSNELKAPSVCSLAMVHASLTNPHITLFCVLQIVPLHLLDGSPPYLKSRRLSVVVSIQLPRWRSPGLLVCSVQGLRKCLLTLHALPLSMTK